MRHKTTATIVALAVLLAGLGTVSAAGAAGVGQDASTGATPVDCSFPVSQTDATGTDVTVEQEPERVVVLAPSAAQTMWEIGAQEKVVGMPVGPTTSYLNGSDSRTNVLNTDMSVNQEKVIAAEPDLVLAPNIVSNDTVQSLRNKGLTVYKFEKAKDLEDVYRKTETTGLLVGEFESAAETRSDMQGTVEAVRSTVEDEDNPRVYYTFYGFSAGPGSFIHELIVAAGGDNIATGEINASSGYGQLSSEVVAKKDPEYIVLPTGAPLPKNDAINGTTAMQEGNVIRVDNNLVSQPGPRNVQPLKTMAKAFHSDAYDADAVESAEGPEPERCESSVTPTATATATATATPSGSPTPTATSTDTETESQATAEPEPATETATDAAATTTSDSGPGFGVLPAALAVALAALAVGRRRL